MQVNPIQVNRTELQHQEQLPPKCTQLCLVNNDGAGTSLPLNRLVGVAGSQTPVDLILLVYPKAEQSILKSQ